MQIPPDLPKPPFSVDALSRALSQGSPSELQAQRLKIQQIRQKLGYPEKAPPPPPVQWKGDPNG